MSHNLGLSNESALDFQYPLHKACRDGNQERVTALLLEGQHDLYEEDGYNGWTPIHWASYFGKLSCVMTLLEYGCSCDSTTIRFNQSPLHIAALGGNGHCLKWLIHCGASKNRQDYLGDTPIHKAARSGNMECISLLLSQNAAIDMKNHNGQTASEVAKDSNHTYCGEYLDKALQLQHDGKLSSTILTVNNGNHSDAFSHLNKLNGHTTMHNGHNGATHGGDCDMEMDISSQPHNNDAGQKTQNGFHSVTDHSEMEGEMPINGCGDNGSSVFRAFNSMKRSLDDEEDEGIKRRCFRENYHPAYHHITPKPGLQSLSDVACMSQSAVEHSLSLQEQRGYDGLISESVYNQ